MVVMLELKPCRQPITTVSTTLRGAWGVHTAVVVVGHPVRVGAAIVCAGTAEEQPR